MDKKKAIILLSGGLDSLTTLYYARSEGFDCYCLTFLYEQRHQREIISAQKITQSLGLLHTLLPITLPWKGSSLLDVAQDLPRDRTAVECSQGIPSTYVTARNTIFLSFAVSWAEVIGAEAVFIGANAIDYSGYPDCRPEYYEAWREVIRTGTKAGVEGREINVQTPLLDKTKSEIIALGHELGAPFELSWSCYEGGEHPCGSCDSCRLRAQGFQDAGIVDPLIASCDDR